MYAQQYPPPETLPPPYSNQISSGPLQPSRNSIDPDERLRKFEYLVNRYEINREFATRLRALEGYEIVFIVDGK